MKKKVSSDAAQLAKKYYFCFHSATTAAVLTFPYLCVLERLLTERPVCSISAFQKHNMSDNHQLSQAKLLNLSE